MKEKLARLLKLIYDNREEITDITPTEGEYYFKFRGKAFSIRPGRNAAFFAYPKWTRPINELTFQGPDSPDANYVHISETESTNYLLYDNIFGELYNFINAQNLGVDKLFSDLGIE